MSKGNTTDNMEPCTVTFTGEDLVSSGGFVEHMDLLIEAKPELNVDSVGSGDPHFYLSFDDANTGMTVELWLGNREDVDKFMDLFDALEGGSDAE